MIYAKKVRNKIVQRSIRRAAGGVLCVSPFVRACKRCSSTMTGNFLAILAIIVGSVKTPVNDGSVRSGGNFLFTCVLPVLRITVETISVL